MSADYFKGIREHWDSLPVKKIEIPEWGFEGDNAIFVKPYNILERNKLRNNDNPVLSAIEVIIQNVKIKMAKKCLDLKIKNASSEKHRLILS